MFEQLPVAARDAADVKTYRTHRVSRDLQIWLVENRLYRSPNKTPDGPEKSIWGREQKEWLKRTMEASDATWKLLLSPTPLVGPDRKTKADNHSNAVFAHEGNELRRWFAEKIGKRFFVINGDRHWQYHSVDPQTGVQEFSIGAASAGNAGGTPGEDPRYHKFHLVQGGFLQIAVEPKGAASQIRFELCDVKGKVAYRFEADSV
jgi:phosphodiesterase/alkaline phosphatase D-like protein